MNNKVCILWDIENVTPSKDSLFVDGLLDYATKHGKISTAIAVGNWAEGSIGHISQSLSEKGLDLAPFGRTLISV
jgi:hypothetical protein